MARRSLLSPFPSRFSHIFDDFRDFDFERSFHRPYWLDDSLENAHNLGSCIGEVERQFRRRFKLPKDAKPELVTSELTKDGKLTIRTPLKEKDCAQTRTVPILYKN
ncbi:unnamed protein product [Thelazia callipaeda]|uniref:SHSP domain-containing protein n=1 Tax=Thelazia callipaeda TaxID=103827 RepID=A0A0N5DAD8_THECL|nr:unnamed protein product [Thelazia callipaeda]